MASVGRNSSYNLMGSAVPLILSLITVPVYLHLIGNERYGVLAIAWVLLGYFGLFDLGLGRATSFRIAALRDATSQERSNTFWAALAANIAMGCAGGLILWFAAEYFFGHLFKVAETIRPEIMESLPWLALSVPVATLTGVLTGALQGREHFLQVNVISAVSTILFQLVPLSIAFLFGPTLFFLLEGAVLVRVVALIWLMYACHRFITRGSRVTFELAEMATLLRYGGWVTVASFFAPMLYMVDRLAIGVMINAVAVTIYTIPLQLTQRIAIVPSALTTALFPRFSASSEEERDALGITATRVLCSVMTAPIVAAIFLIEPFLVLWVGPDLAAKAAPVAHILLIGFWANSLALVPFNQLQARGRPDLVTKILIGEVPPYLTALYFGLREFGLFGCAVVQTLRFIGDFILLTLVARRSISDWKILFLNFSLLLTSAFCAGYWNNAYWFLLPTGTLLAAATAILGWNTFPAIQKEAILRPLRNKFTKMKIRFSA
jgi:O-antigen/teichoic acid export membrane protein